MRPSTVLEMFASLSFYVGRALMSLTQLIIDNSDYGPLRESVRESFKQIKYTVEGIDKELEMWLTQYTPEREKEEKSKGENNG